MSFVFEFVKISEMITSIELQKCMCVTCMFQRVQERKYYKTKHISFKDNHVVFNGIHVP